MGQSAEGDAMHPRLGVPLEIFQGDAPGGFEFGAVAQSLDDGADLIRGLVVEQQEFGTHIARPFRVLKGFDLDLDPDNGYEVDGSDSRTII